MFERTVTGDDLTQLKREREDADRLYNEMLTALDAAVMQLREMPHQPPASDEFQVTPLNQQWDVLSLKSAERGGWIGRLSAHVWRIVGPLFERQQAFNSALVDHINRNIAVHRASAQAMAATLEVLRQEHEGLLAFQAKLILFAQQITPYVDTKDRELAGLMRRINEDVAEAADQLDWKVVRLQDAFKGLVGGFSGLSDDMQKRRESMLSRERRYQAEVAEVRAALSVVQRASQTFKRELEQSTAAPAARPVESHPSPAPGLDSYKYVAFEDQFRGSPHEIRERLAGYLPDFEGAQDVLDIGCGRGEFLELLRERGITARGVDINAEMAAICRERGLDATAGDALTYLREQPDASLGGLFAAQVVEHLEPDYLMGLLDAAYHKLRPGSKIVLETINPACWYAFFSSYIRDITHVVPLHPDTLRFLLIASGFQHVDIRFSAPFPEESKLQAISAPARQPASAGAADVAPTATVTAVFNENVRKLNDLLFTHLDYAAIGVRV